MFCFLFRLLVSSFSCILYVLVLFTLSNVFLIHTSVINKSDYYNVWRALPSTIHQYGANSRSREGNTSQQFLHGHIQYSTRSRQETKTFQINELEKDVNASSSDALFNDVVYRNHLVNDATTIHLYTRKKLLGTVLIEVDKDFRIFSDENVKQSHCLQSKYELCATTKRRCKYCYSMTDSVGSPRPDCLHGNFRWNARKIKSSTWKYNIESRRPLNYYETYNLPALVEVVFECSFDKDIKSDEEILYRNRHSQLTDTPLTNASFSGTLTIPYIHKNSQIDKVIVSKLNMNPHTKALVSNKSINRQNCLVCGRILFGDVSSESLAKFVEYYKFHGLGGVILYDVGLAKLDSSNYLEKYILDGSLTIIDLRKFFQGLYGPSHRNIFILRSMLVGQMWTRYDCLLRARRHGFKWALFLDNDEYLSFGVSNYFKGKGRMRKLYQYINSLSDGIVWNSFGTLSNPIDMQNCQNGQALELLTQNESNAGLFRWNWSRFQARLSFIHSKTEAPNGTDFFVFKKHSISGQTVDRCLNYHMCRDFAGARAILARTDVEPLALERYSIQEGANRPGQDIDVDDMYIRRYRC